MKNSHIQWTDHTFNPWEGCTMISPGCANCYAESRNARFGGGVAPNWGKGKPRRRTSPALWKDPLRWNREAMETSLNSGSREDFQRPRVFCASLADVFDEEVPIEWLADLATLWFDCGFLTWQILTKRPENVKHRLSAAAMFIKNHRDPTERNCVIYNWMFKWLTGVSVPPNIWLGVSVENQQVANDRIPVLLAIPAAIRFLSVEPLLEEVSLTRLKPGNGFHIDCLRGLTFWEGRNEPQEIDSKIDWVIVGGESGPGARPFFAEWALFIRDDCISADIPVLIKQLGANVHTSNLNLMDWPDETMFEDGPHKKTMAGAAIILRDKKGGEMEEWPEQLRIRRFPKEVRA